MLSWEISIEKFVNFLRLERALSSNSISAYRNDIKKLREFLATNKQAVSPTQIDFDHLRDFLHWINELGMSPTSQSRVISGVKAFFKYLLIENYIEKDPTELLESPRIGRRLPEVLTVEEIDQIIGAIDLSQGEGQRNKAIIETLYSCGLRVSELIHLRISNLYLDKGFIRVIGKGNKERLIPISQKAIKEISYYLQDRNKLQIAHGCDDYLFLNRRGKQLTRVMVFVIVKKLAEKAGIQKNISPHTFRHSFASHLIEGGADLRAIQDMLGHESITTTETYTHLDRTYLRETIIEHHPRS
ncbi:MAG TPA: site-specific tyrosine recombinase XerD [Bacteroidales bacterium]|nr:site-specific tyrosine recombinase XerD [Bacteroidales bacterium]